MSEWGRVIEAAEEDIARRAQEANWLRGRLRAAEWEAVERSRRITFLEAKLAEVEKARAATLALEREIVDRGGELPSATPAQAAGRVSASISLEAEGVSASEWKSRCEQAQQELEMRTFYLEDKEAFWEEEMRKLEAQVERQEAELAAARSHLGEFGRAQGEGDVAAHERQAAALRERAQFKQRLKDVTAERDAARSSTADLVQRVSAAEEARGRLEGDLATFRRGLAQLLWDGGLHKGEGTAADMVGLVRTMVEGLRADLSLQRVSPLGQASRVADLRESALINELQSTYREADKLLQGLEKPENGGRGGKAGSLPPPRSSALASNPGGSRPAPQVPARTGPEGSKRTASVTFAEDEPKASREPKPPADPAQSLPSSEVPAVKETPLPVQVDGNNPGDKVAARAGVGAPADDTPAPAVSKKVSAPKMVDKGTEGESAPAPRVAPPSRVPPPSRAPPPSSSSSSADNQGAGAAGPSQQPAMASEASLEAASASLEAASASLEVSGTGPGIIDFQVYGPLTLGSMLRACGRPVNGTSMCHFQWQRADFTGGEFYDIIDAGAPDYTLSADDVGHILRVVCTPVMESGEAGSITVYEVAKGEVLELDESAAGIIDEFVSKGTANFDIRIAGSDSPEVASLSVDRKTLTILKPNRSVLLKETLATAQPRFLLHPESPLACKIEIHGQPTHIKFEDARLRDIAVLTARQLSENAKKEKNKTKSFFFKGRKK